MTKIPPEQLEHDWSRLLARAPDGVRAHIHAIAVREQTMLATHFYAQMLQDPTASRLLSHEQVQTQLHASMRRWIAGLFEPHAGEALTAMVAQQAHVGDVHARIDVPMHLVLRGARCLKDKLLELLAADASLGPVWQCDAAALMVSVIDLAMEIMGQSYHVSRARNERASEAYRLHSVAQNIGAERERQRAALLEWENQFMFDMAMGTPAAQLPRISASDFGLWFRHKGAHAFQGTAETEQILDTLSHIDEVLLPMFHQSEDMPAIPHQQELRELRERTKSLVFLLETLFEHSGELDAGRDVLTRLLNRKFLPVVMGKEVKYARDHRSTFAVLVIDVDHFKLVNDNHGHEVGDMVLQQLASVLLNVSRGGDYAFRLGGEEFLLLLVDVSHAQALSAAEKLRRQVEEEEFRLPNGETLRVTVSIGVALHHGHPDYQQMLRRGDDAAYEAKRRGRNCVVAAPD